VARSDSDDARRHMDGIYRHQRYIYDATRKYFLLGRDRMLDGLRPPAGGSILEIGCGTGRNLILAARRYPDARLYGFDISEAMLDTARRSIVRAGLAERISLARGDASAFDPEAMFGRAVFDRVFVSYALSMIPPWREALPMAMRVVAPGGSLHVVDFGRQTGLPGWFRSGLCAWLARFSVEPRADLEAELAKLAAASSVSLRFERLYRDYAQLGVVSRT
jgi:S-adenosylmethionine-diacylgycerolhomoserine-N-methlytransferase